MDDMGPSRPEISKMVNMFDVVQSTDEYLTAVLCISQNCPVVRLL